MLHLSYDASKPGDCAVALSANYAGLVREGRVTIDATSAPLSVLGGEYPEHPTALILALIQSVADPEIQNVLTKFDDPKAEALFNEWISKVNSHMYNFDDASTIEAVDKLLEDRTFLHGEHIRLTDLLVFASVYNWMKDPHDAFRCTHLTRWFDHIQHLPGIFGNEHNPFALLNVGSSAWKTKLATLEAVLDEELKQMESSELAKSKGSQPIVAKSQPQAKSSKPFLPEEDEHKKTDLGKKAKQPSSQQTSGVSVRPPDDVTRLNIRVGKITKVWVHPQADGLYCELIDIGESVPLRIVSNLRKFIPIEKMEEAQCLVLTNLPEKKLRGQVSQGMVLCGSHGDTVELLQPPAEAKVGERVVFPGHEGDPDPLLCTKSKRETFSLIQKDLKIRSDGIACYKDIPFTTSAGPCSCPTLKEGNIS